MENICQQNNLLVERNGIIRLPFLVKGRLVMPPDMSRAEVESAFDKVEPETRYIKLEHAQLIREAEIDRASLQYTGKHRYQVLPSVDPIELIETDLDSLAHGLYALKVEEVLEFLQAVRQTLQENSTTIERTRELTRRTSEHPDLFLDGSFSFLLGAFDTEAARCIIDNELALWQIPGSRFLDGWVNVPAKVFAGLTPILAGMLAGGYPDRSDPGSANIRAMPTRQLHITAGNAPEVPWASALRLILSKSAGVIKLPQEATLSGALLGLSALAAQPDHPLTRNLSIVYWHGGDDSIENSLFNPGAFDRIVVWGAPEAVKSVQAKAQFTKTLSFNPRYGATLIGKEAFEGDLEEIAFAAALDVMIYSQRACTSSLIQYIEGTVEQARTYAKCLVSVLNRWDELAPPFVPPAVRGTIKRMKRGRYLRADWLTNQKDNEFTSGVAVISDEFDIFDHPMNRLVIVRPVATLNDALRYLHPGVSTVGVHPEERRKELRDAIAARGVSTILPIGQCEHIFPGGPQDGMIVLSQLVDWKYS